MSKFVLFFKKIDYRILILILVSSFLLLYKIAEIPMGLNQDETVNAVDAWNLSQTGKDFHGNPLPILLESYGDWASPLLTYFSVPFFAVLGPSVFTTRLPVAVLGVFSVIAFYYLIKNVFKNNWFAFIITLVYATSPWFITFSRWAIPPSSSFTFVSLLFLFQYLATNAKVLWKKIVYFLFLAVSAGLLSYSYPVLKLFVPIYLLCAAAIYYVPVVFKILIGLLVKSDKVIDFKPWYKKYKSELVEIGIFLLAGLVYVGSVLPMYLLSFLEPEKYNARFNSVALPEDYKLFRFLAQYLTYFSPDFLFGEGDGNWMHRAPNFSSVPSYLVIFFYFGLASLIFFIGYYLFKLVKKEQDQTNIFILEIFKKFDIRFLASLVPAVLIWPLAASLTKDPRIFIRVVYGMPIIYLICTFGIYVIWQILKKYTNDKLVKLATVIFVVGSVFWAGLFYNYYTTTYKLQSQGAYNYGRIEVLSYVKTQPAKKVLLDRDINTPDYLLHLNITPQELQKLPIKTRFDIFDRYEIILNASTYRNAKYPIIYKVESNGRMWFEIRRVNSETLLVVRVPESESFK